MNLKYYHILLLLFIVIAMFFSCTSPTDVGTVISEPVNDDGSGILTTNKDTLNFGFVHPGKTKTLNFTLTNISESKVKISEYKVSLTDTWSFEPKIFTLEKKEQPNSSQLIEVVTQKSIPGIYIDTLTFNKYQFPKITLTTVVPSLYFEFKEFEDTYVNDRVGQVLKVINIGSKPVTLTNHSFSSNGDIFDFSNEIEFPITINANSSNNDIIIRFKPDKLGHFETELTFEFEPEEGFYEKTILLKGKGI